MNKTSAKPMPKMAGSTIPAPHAESISRRKRLANQTRQVWTILHLAVNKFLQIDGAQWAGTFAFNAFFSLFPLLILFVTIASAFFDRDRAGQEVIAYMENYVPISGEMQHYIFDTITGVIITRGSASVIAFLMLGWAAIQFFSALISSTNRAWGVKADNWWRWPLKSLVFLAIMVSMVLLGVVVPVLAKMAKDWLFPMNDFSSWVYSLVSFFIPLIVVFLSLSLFYRLAPRRPTRFAEVWVAALCATALLQAAENLFVIYLKNFSTFNAVYGMFGGIMALLLWIYLSGCIFIFGACLCAAQAKSREQFTDVERSFSPEDALVLREGNDIILRLVGLNFPSAASTIEQKSFDLLTKVRDAINSYPGSTVSVLGNTDSYDGDAINLELSKKRAEAVKQYLLANSDLSDSRINVIGYGESKPIASNETMDGRATNRRVEVVIHPKQTEELFGFNISK